MVHKSPTNKSPGAAKKKPMHMNKIKAGNASTNPDRKAPTGATHMRSKATINRLNMYKMKPVRDKKGGLVSGSFMSRETTHDTRIQPNRKWFNNTRTVGQDQLEKFRTAMSNTVSNPYTVLLKPGKIPFGLLSESTKVPRVKILETESFESSYGPKSQRKRPRLSFDDYGLLANKSAESSEAYDITKDKNVPVEEDHFKPAQKELCFEKGTSRRLWGELYKVLDSSDVVIQVLDARDPAGTRSAHLENHIRNVAKHKHLVILLNKCDLVPPWVTAQWTWYLSREWPTVAFHASLTHPFGKGALIMLLRQFAGLHPEKKQLSIGFVGYPNVGKSSIINTLRSKKVCKVAPLPGETKVWQYIAMTKKISLIDCPGVVPPENHSNSDSVLRGVVRIENLKFPQDYIKHVLARVKPEYILRTYGIKQWTDAEDFLEKISERYGRLLKKGEYDTASAARSVLHDWQRGKLPYFSMPPEVQGGEPPRKKQKLEVVAAAEAAAVKKEEEVDGAGAKIEGAEGEGEEANAEGKEEDDEEEVSEVTGNLSGVVQNFRKIAVKLEYNDEDMDTALPTNMNDSGPDWDELFEALDKDENDEPLVENNEIYVSDEESDEDNEGLAGGDVDMNAADEEGAKPDEEGVESEVKTEEDEEDGGAIDDQLESIISAISSKQKEKPKPKPKTKSSLEERRVKTRYESPKELKKKGRNQRKATSDDDEPVKKAPRMKTSKKQVVNFYSTADVKNKKARKGNIKNSRSKRHQTL